MKKKLVKIAIISLVLFGASFIVHQSRPVFAASYGCNSNSGSQDYLRFPYGFFCPRNDGGNYSQVNLSNGPETPKGKYNPTRSLTGAEYLSPGQTLRFSTGYDKEGAVRTAPPNDSSSGSPDNDLDPTNNWVYVWTIVDANDSILESISGDTGTSNGAHATRSCPSAPGVQGYEGSGVNDPDRSPFAGGGLDGNVNCGSDGKMILWRLNTADANSIGTESLKFKIKLKDDLPYGNYEVCLRTIVSVRYNTGADNEDPFDLNKLSHIAAKSKYRCYNVGSTRIEGTVRSSETNATGKLLPSVTIFYDQNCNGTIDKQTTTNANGKYEFNSNVGELYCLYARGSTGAPPPRNTEIEESEGTRYTNPEGLYRGLNIVSATGITWQVAGVGCGDDAQGSNSNSDNYYPNCFGRTQDMRAGYEQESTAPDASNVKGHDFKFNPVPTPPSIEKISFPEGTDENGNPLPLGDNRLRPGDRVGFTITVTNSIDANQYVDIRDYIPLNMVADMSQIQLDCVEIDPAGSAPATWFVYDSSVDCRSEGDTLIQNAPNYFEFGNDETELFTYFNEPFYYRENPGSGSTAPYLGFDVRRMPAYSQITMEWSGYVKPADQIGVYPGYTAAENVGDYRYCASANGNTFNNNSSRLMSECEDLTNGYQGVANYVVTTAQGSITPRYSNTTYDPIPGEITNFTKDIAPPTTFGGGDAYSIEDPAYNFADFRMDVTPNDKRGPIRFRVSDQSQGAALPPAVADIDNILPGAPGDFSRGAGNANSLGAVNWREYNSSQPGAQKTFSFHVNSFDGDAGIGATWTNTASVCYKKYWENPHTNDECKFASDQMQRIRMEEPNIAVDYGGVTAGGNIKVTNESKSCTAGAGSGNLIGNGGSYGMYMLSVQNSGTYNKFLSRSGFSVSSGSNDGLKCRPDLPSEARRHPLALTDQLPGAYNTFGGSPDGKNNRIIRASGELEIPASGLEVKGRYTLYVEGRVYIKGNITNKPGTNIVSNSNSLGIIATEGIYISNNVSRVDALLYAGTRDTIAGGEIDTCAANQSTRLQKRYTGSGYSAADCRVTKLTINGAMYARKLKLNRTLVAVNTYADRINLGNLGGLGQGSQALLMMPPAFNVLEPSGNSGSIREQRPRF